MRVNGNGMVLGSVAEVLRHGRCIYDLARIHPVFGIERGLDVLERSIKLRSKQFFVQMTTRESVPMFTAHPATEFHYEVGDFVGHVFHDLNVASIFGVNERPDVKTTNTSVAIVAGAGVVLVNDVAEFHEKFREL